MERTMNVYFSCSITGGRSEENIYQAMVKKLLFLGHEVPTAHLSSSEVLSVEKVSSPEEIFERDMNWLHHCDAVVAEVTSPSHGVGYEIAVALAAGKPVLCCYQRGRKISLILTGNSASNLFLYSYESEKDVLEGIEKFMQKLAL
jgi:2'-deoxynucleoside 5'-phosphate N-hydrolase